MEIEPTTMLDSKIHEKNFDGKGKVKYDLKEALSVYFPMFAFSMHNPTLFAFLICSFSRSTTSVLPLAIAYIERHSGINNIVCIISEVYGVTRTLLGLP